MADLTLACDFGSSLGRGIYSLDTHTLRTELLLIGPEAIEVPESAIRNYEQYVIGGATPERSAWISYNDSYYAVGHLARAHFGALHCLESLKIDSALQTTLALVGAIAEAKSLPDSFTLSLGILLPWGEYTDRDRFQERIAKALSSFSFRRRELSVTLEKFSCLPEGAGLFARGRVAAGSGEKLRSAKELAIVVVMIGYRNISLLYVNCGQLEWGETENFGCGQMIRKVRTLTSGQQADALVRAICQSPKPSRKALSSLVRTKVPELRDTEIDSIGKAIADAKSEYLTALTHWLRQKLPNDIDEIVISGGTSRYLKPELTRFFHSVSPNVNWCEPLDDRVKRAFGDVVDKYSLGSRLSDVYGLFYTLQNRPLPRLRDLDNSSVQGEGTHERQVS